jgi:hypothetical protein
MAQNKRIESLQKALSAGQPAPSLVVLRHDSPCEEKFTRNGIVRAVHVVVKNAPLPILLGLQKNVLPGGVVDFGHFTIDCRLVYDTDGPNEKEVDFVKSKPLEVKTSAGPGIVPSDQLQMELKIKVLTSQHEDMFFRAKIVALDPLTGREFTPSIIAYSEPIKVISKPEQLKKRKPTKKRTLTEMLMDTVQRIEQQQQDQHRLIERLLTQQPVPSTASASAQSAGAAGLPDSLPVNWPSERKAEGPVDFESAFASFVTSYTSLPYEQKPEKIRRLLRGCSHQDLERFTELIDLFTQEAMQQGMGLPGLDPLSGPTCRCPTCPHRQELMRVDDFYKEFISAPTFDASGDLPPTFD